MLIFLRVIFTEGGRARRCMCKDGSTCFVFCPDPPENTTCTNTLKTPQDTSQEGEETDWSNQGEQMNCLNISVTTWSSYFSLLIQFYILATKDTNYSVCVNLKLSSFKKFETLTIVKINYWRSFSVYNLITELNSGSCAKRKHNVHETLTRRC